MASSALGVRFTHFFIFSSPWRLAFLMMSAMRLADCAFCTLCLSASIQVSGLYLTLEPFHPLCAKGGHLVRITPSQTALLRPELFYHRIGLTWIGYHNDGLRNLQRFGGLVE